MDNEKLGTPDAEEQARLLAEEARGLKWCLRHPSGYAVYYDGPECPACQLENENREEAAKVFLEMTQDLSTENHNEKT